MSQLIKQYWTESELTDYLATKDNEYLLSHYTQAVSVFEEDVRQRRYSHNAELVRETLKQLILQRMKHHEQEETHNG